MFKLVEIVDVDGHINYDQALTDLKVFLFGRKGKVDTNLHLNDLRFYLKPTNLLFALNSFSLTLLPKVLSLWSDLSFKTLHRYFQLNIIAVVNKLKEQAKMRRAKHEK